MKNIEFGVVTVLDVLGMKNYSVADSIQFIEHRDELIQSVCESSTNFFDQLKIVPEIKIATFGDTIIICWPTNDENLIGYNLLGMSHLMKLAICWGISKKIFFRGAMSVGEYFSHGQTILGPAINDAVSWCEEVNWFGVIFTPKCKYCAVSSLIEESPFNDIIN